MTKLIPSYMGLYLFFSISAFAAIQETTWHPDTCDGCVVTYTWDDAVPVEQRVFKFKSIVKADESLPELKGEDLYLAILERNQRKNKAYKEILETMPAATEEVTAVDGTVTKTVKDFQYRYDEKGNLIVSADGLAVDAALKTEGVTVE